MLSNDIFSFKYDPKGLPDSARVNFLENAKEQLIGHIKDAVGNLTKGVLEVEGKIDGNTISLNILDTRSEGSKVAEKKAQSFFNEKNQDDFFNVVTEDEFRNRVQNEARKIHPELLRLFLESRSVFTR